MYVQGVNCYKMCKKLLISLLCKNMHVVCIKWACFYPLGYGGGTSDHPLGPWCIATDVFYCLLMKYHIHFRKMMCISNIAYHQISKQEKYDMPQMRM